MAGRTFTAEMALHNIAGSLQLFEAAISAGVERHRVHLELCGARPYSQGSPPRRDAPDVGGVALWSPQGRGRGVCCSYALGEKFPICALRPTGIYGVNHPIEKSKWYDLIASIVADSPAECHGGGKEVHAADVAKAASLLLHADANRIAGEAFNCYDCYVSNYEVATLAKAVAGGHAEISGEPCATQTSDRNR